MNKVIKLPPADAFNYPNRGYKRGSRDYYKELRASRQSWNAFRAKLLQQQDFRCAYCNINLKGKRMNVEHVLALTNGGNNSKDNLVAACWVCNKEKGVRRLSKDELVTLHKNLKRLKKKSITSWIDKKEYYDSIVSTQDNHLRSIINGDS